MTPAEIAEMQADALAGTQGDWYFDIETDAIIAVEDAYQICYDATDVDGRRIARVPQYEATIVADAAIKAAQAAEIERLTDLLNKDVSSILKGRDVVQPHMHLFDGQDTTSYWKLRAEMGEAAAIRAIKIGEEYLQKAVKIQRKADAEADQASERFKKERKRADIQKTTIIAQAAEIERLRMDLAETEALEMQHGAVIERLRAALNQIKWHRDYQIPTPQSIASAVLEGTPK